jgi:peptide/nickel transport system substrate-binding protein
LIVLSLIVLSFVLVACAAPEPTKAPLPPAPPAVSGTAAPTKPPVATAAPSTAAPKRGGKITMVVWQSPVTLNYYFGTQSITYDVLAFVSEGLTFSMPNGERAPALAKEVPTVQNGGVSADGKTITYKLKDGLVWSDGKPLTCDDVKFTWQAIMTPAMGVVSTTGYSDIGSIDCPNPTTVVMNFKNFYAPYLTLFANQIIPKHYAGDVKGMKNWEFNRKPLGTGPFKIDEWVADSHVVLSRNTNYREKDKPYLDQVVIRIVPSSDAALQMLSSGEVDIMWNNTESELPMLQKMQGVKISEPLQVGGERMFLNTAENKDPSDPKKPHLILGDVRVRQAIAYGLNNQRIIDRLLYGKAKPGTTELNGDPFDCKIAGYSYDPAKAKKLLDEAGWIPGPDGIRIAKGAKFAPDGTRLRLKFSTTSGNKLREDSQVLWMEDMKAIGVEFYIENAPSAVVIGTWEGNSPRRRGNFDIVMHGAVYVDPHPQMVKYFASWEIPSESNKAGTNFSRFADAKVDDLLKAAGGEPDMAKRLAMHCQVAGIAREAASVIYLYQRLKIDSYRDRLQGWVDNVWGNNGWNSQDWWIK